MMSTSFKLVLLAANSTDTTDSRTDAEIQAIDRAIQESPLRDRFKIEKEVALRVSDIGRALLRHNPDFLHISAHSRKSEGLILENDHGHVAKVQCSHLKEMLFSMGPKLQLVFLAFCHSAECAEATANRIDFVLGFKGNMGVRSSLASVPGFYAALASGKSIEQAIAYAKSILAVRKLGGADRLVLQATSGADISRSVVQPKPFTGELKAILDRVIQGAGTEMDRSNLREAIDKGVLVLDQQDDEIEDTQKEPKVNFTETSGTLHAFFPPGDFRKIRELTYPIPQGIAPPLPPRFFIGRHDSLEEIKRMLTVNRRNADQERITVVRGWPGVGKTSLVSAIGHNPEISKSFKDGVLWISLEQKPNIITEMARWGRALGSDEILKAPTVREATSLLAALLSKREMLLIVDDVWEPGHATAFINAAGNQCSVMVTTRLPWVTDALTTDSAQTYQLPVLTDEFALKLLRLLVPEVVSRHEVECRALVKELECLPLALHVAAGLLRSEARMEWGVIDLIERLRKGTDLLNEPAPKDRIQKDGTIPSVKTLLERSTDVLDEQTRQCFAGLGVFRPKPTTFDLSALQAVWLVDDPRPIVRKLVRHGLLEPSGGRFQMHRILVDHARSLCTEDE